MTDQSVEFGFFQTTNLSPLSTIDWGKSVGMLDVLQIGSHAPCSDICKVECISFEGVLAPRNAVVVDTHNDTRNRTMTQEDNCTMVVYVFFQSSGEKTP